MEKLVMKSPQKIPYQEDDKMSDQQTQNENKKADPVEQEHQNVIWTENIVKHDFGLFKEQKAQEKEEVQQNNKENEIQSKDNKKQKVQDQQQEEPKEEIIEKQEEKISKPEKETSQFQSIFSNVAQNNENPTEKKDNSIFQGNSIFKTHSNSQTIFGNTNNNQSQQFQSIFEQKSNLFNMGSQQNQENEQNENDEEIEKEVHIIPENAVIKLQPVEQKSDFQKLLQKNVINFKMNQEDGLLEGSVSIEQFKDFPLFVIVFRNKALQIKCALSVYKKNSITKIAGSQKDVLIIQAFRLPEVLRFLEIKKLVYNEESKEEVEVEIPKLNFVKLQFASSEFLNEFNQEYKKIMEITE